MRFSTKRYPQGFTIAEILIIIVVISVGLLSVLVVLSNGTKYIQKTRQKVIALNLAREWMEAVYQMRDTNRTRRAGVKDFCWLKTNPLVDEWVASCSNDAWFTTWNYALHRLTTWGQQYFALSGPMLTWVDFANGVDVDDVFFSLCQQSGYWDSCMWQSWTTPEWLYFRQIEWIWLYAKDVAATWWTELLCTGWLSPQCGNERAKEFRFCSKVSYIGESTGEVKLCGVITNFKGK